MKQFGRISALLGLLVFAASFAGATTITYTATSGTTLGAQADFTTSAGQLQLVLTNTALPSNIISSGQAISGITFTLSNAPGTSSSPTASGQLGNFGYGSNNTVTYIVGDPSRWISSGGFTIASNTITLSALSGGQPEQLILPYVANGGKYGNGNQGLDNFIPYVIGSGTFTLNLSGVTANTTISNVTFSFGTNSESTLPGTPGEPRNPVPEPASMLLLGTGLVGLAGTIRRRMK